MLAALTDFGAPVSNLNVEELAKPGLLYVFGIPPLRVDLLNRIKGVNAERIVKRAKRVALGRRSLRVVSLEDLIRLKRLAGRAQDRADLEKLIARKKPRRR